nr:Zinc finger domain containing protein [Haemonchus contortus]
MSDDMERELDRILEEEVAQDSRMEELHQELAQLRAQVMQLTQQNLEQVLNSVSQCALSVANLRDVPKQIASLFREDKIVSPEDAENELTKLLTPECDAILLAQDPLSETAAKVKKMASETHVKHSEELSPIFDQAEHDDYCMRTLSKLLQVQSTEVVGAVKTLVKKHQKLVRTQLPSLGKKILPARTPLTLDNFDNRQTCILQGTSTSAQSEAQPTPMETEHGETEHNKFREAFRLLNSKDYTTEAGLPPIEFDAVNAAKGRLLSQQDDSLESARANRTLTENQFQRNSDVSEPRHTMAPPSPTRGNPPRGLSPESCETSPSFTYGIGTTLAAMALPEVKNFSNPDGKGFTEFVMSFSMKYGRIGLPDDILIHLMSEKLEGHPKAVMKTLPEETRNGKFADFVVALKAKFAENTSARRMESHVKLKQLKMARSVMEYCVQLESLTRAANPQASETDLSMVRASELISQLTTWPEYFQLFAVMEAAAPHEVYEKLKNLAQGIERSKRVAAAMKSATESKQFEERRRPSRATVFSRIKDKTNQDGNVQDQHHHKEQGQQSLEITQKGAQTPADTRLCRKCKRPGHFQRDCDKNVQRTAPQSAESAQSSNASRMEHSKRTFTTVLQNWSCQAVGTRQREDEMFGKKTMCRVELLGFVKEALVDTGSQVSILPLKILLDASQAGFDLDKDVEEVKMDNHTNIYDASGHKMKFKGAVKLSLALHQEPVRRVVFCVKESSDDTIVLGTNILRSSGFQALLEPMIGTKHRLRGVQASSCRNELRTVATQTNSHKNTKRRKPIKCRSEDTVQEENTAHSAVIVSRVYLRPGETKKVSIKRNSSGLAQILWSQCDQIPHACCGRGETVNLPSIARQNARERNGKERESMKRSYDGRCNVVEKPLQVGDRVYMKVPMEKGTSAHPKLKNDRTGPFRVVKISENSATVTATTGDKDPLRIPFDQLRKLPAGVDDEPAITSKHRAKRGRPKKTDKRMSANAVSFRVEVGDPRFDPLHLLFPCQCGMFNTRAQVGLPGLRCDLTRECYFCAIVAMSGRGKGGKGLGKGGAKRHRKVLRDSIQGITKPTTSNVPAAQMDTRKRKGFDAYYIKDVKQKRKEVAHAMKQMGRKDKPPESASRRRGV